jgi:glycerol-3-phosphate dehydrogenase
LAERPFDVVVVGGGIFGACAAWDAAQRGLSVALIERGDFGAATSANSFKLIHGGIRYIQHGDIFRVRQSSNERRAFLRIAPHLVHPLPILIPTYGYGMRGRALLRTGMALYDLLTADRNRGIGDPQRKVPRGRGVSRQEVLARFPGLEKNGLTGGALFRDGQMYNPPRLVLAFVQSAVEQGGAVATNHVEATGLLRKSDRVTGVRARDVLSGAEFDVRGKVVLNTAGPYAERLLLRAAGVELSPPGTYSRDVCFIVPRTLADGDWALAVQGRSRDPQALLSRGARHLFLAPWRDYTVVGTWHVVYADDPDRFTVSDEELERFIREINSGYPELDLSLDDVSVWNAGLVPFGENPQDAEDLKYGHRSRLVDHADEHGLENLITLIGVRYTTGRYEAERAVNLAFRKLGLRPPRCGTAMTPVSGGGINDWKAFVESSRRRHGTALDDDVVESLLHNYGSDYERILRLVDADVGLAARLGDSTTIKAQALHAVRHEMAETVADIVFRRTDLATGVYPGRTVLAECASLLAAERSLGPDALERQVRDVVARFPAWEVERVDRRPAPG